MAQGLATPECGAWFGRELIVEGNGSTIWLGVYDAAGAPVVPFGAVTPRDGCDLRGELDVEPGFPSGVCRQVSEDEYTCMLSRGLLTFVLAFQPIGQQVQWYRYIYYPNGPTTSTATTFFLPHAYFSVPDIWFELVDGTVRAHFAAASGQHIEDVLGDRWVLPYELPAFCAAVGCAQDDDSSFLAAVDPVDVGIPSIDLSVPTSYEFSGVGTARIQPPGGVTTLWNLTGLTVRFPPGQSLEVAGGFTAAGTTFTSAVPAPVPSERWGGVHVASGTTSLNGGEVSNAGVGLTAYQGATVGITDTRLKFNGVGLRVLSNTGVMLTAAGLDLNETGLESDWVQEYGQPPGCQTNCRSAFTLQRRPVPPFQSSYVTENSGIGLNVVNADAIMTNTVVWDNAGGGIRLANAALATFTSNEVTWNGYPSGFGQLGRGVSVLAAGTFRFSPDEAGGFNLIDANASTEINVGASGVAFGGVDDPFDPTGFNDILDLVNGGELIRHGGDGKLYAANTFWGYSTGPPSGSLVGSVYPDPHLECSALGDPCGGLHAGPATAAGFGSPGGDRGTTIRALRATIAESPGGPLAPSLIQELASLHRLDPDDATGEWARTTVFLASLRERLPDVTISDGLRATAEAALEAAAVLALTMEEYAAARVLVRDFTPFVRDGSRIRRIEVIHAFLDAQNGAFAEGAARLRVVAAGTPDLGDAAEYLALATHFEGRAADSRLVPESPLVELPEERAATWLSVAPNPTSGAAAVRLYIDAPGGTHVVVHDVLGRLVATLVDGVLEVGQYEYQLDGARWPAGVYVVRASLSRSGSARVAAARFTVVR